ncbi:MAG: Hpt domain-containing protein, partial [Chitinophagaceae bacterium]
AGMNDFISKPFSLQELIQKITQYANKSRQEQVIQDKDVDADIAPAALYDLSYLDEMDDKEYSKEVIQMVIQATPLALEEIKNGIGQRNWKEVYQKAHRLKSSTGLLKMQSLTELLTIIESNAKGSTNLDEMAMLAEKAQSLYKNIHLLLQEEIKELS